ncbi:MAG: autotransporter-associated beta strand repeat-containing protein [Luteolibacter sp.]
MNPRKNNPFLRISAFLPLSIGLVFAGMSAQAASLYWDTDATTAGNGTLAGTWGTTAYWATVSGGSAATGAYVSGSDAVFFAAPGAAGPTSVTVTGTQVANSITYNGTSNLVISAGTALQIAGGGITVASGSGTFGITTPIQLTANQVWTNNSGSQLTVNSVGETSASLGFTKTGTGQISINAAGTYTGTTTIERGNLNPGVTNALGSGVSAIALGNATTITQNYSPSLLLGGTTFLSRDITVGASNTAQASGTYTIGSSNNSTQTSIFGTVTLNQNLIVNAGGATFTLAGSVTSGTSSLRTVTFNSGSLLASSAIGGGVGTIALAKTGTGTTTLTGVSSYTGDTTISNGALTIGGAGQLGAGSYAGAIANATTFNYNSSANQTFSGIISGLGTLNKSNTSTLTLSGSNNYSGDTGVNGGALTLNFSTNNNSKIAGVLTLAGGTINLSGGSTAQTVTSTTLNPGESTINQAGGTSTLALGGITRTSGSVLNLGTSGIATTTSGLGGANSLATTSTGVLGVVGGNDWLARNATTGLVGLSTVASYTSSTATSVSGNADVVGNVADTALSASTLRFNAAAASTVDATGGSLTLTEGGILVTSTVGNNLTTITGGSVKADTKNALIIIQNNTSNGLTIASTVANGSGASALTKAGAGLLTLSNASNSYTGKTYLVGGTLNIAADLSLGTAPGSAVADQLTINGGTLQFGAASISLATNRGITLGGNGATFDTSGNAATVAGIITGALNSVTKIGAGTLSLTGANTYTGSTTVNAGTLTVGTGGTLGTASGASSGALAVNNPNTGAGTDVVLNLATAVDTTVGSLSGTIATPSGGINTATINNGGSGRNFTVNQNVAGTYGGVIAGAGNFTLGFANTLTLTGANTYSGTTTINGGVLQLGNGGATGSLSTSSAITNNANLTINRNNPVTQGTDFSAAAITGTGSFTQAGTGTTTFNVQNTYSGVTTINAGTLTVTTNNGLSNTPTITVNNGGTLALTIGDALGAAANKDALVINSGGQVLNNGIASRVTIQNTVNMTGGILGGSSVGDANGTYSFNTPTAVNATSDASGTAALINASKISLQGGTATFNVTRGTAIPAADMIISSDIAPFSGNGNGITKTGTGILVLSGANTYTGGTRFTGGIINLGSAGALGSTGTLIFNGGTLQYSAANTTDYSSRLSGNNSERSYIIDTNGQNVTFASNLVAATGANLTKVGAGTLTLSAANNTYTGSINVTAGTLQAGAVNGYGTTGGNSIVLGTANTAAGDAPSLLVNGAFSVVRNITVGSLTNTAAYNATLGGSNTTGTSGFAGNVTLNTTAANYTAILQAATGGTVDFTGTWVTNNKAVAIGASGKTGTVQLSSAIATSGGITVNFGTLALNSAYTGGNMAVSSGATLGGTGSVTGTTGVTSGTINGSGLTLTGLTTFNSTGNVLSGTETVTAGVVLASFAALANSAIVTGGIAVGNGTLTGTGGSFSGASTLNGGTINLTSGNFGSTLGVMGGNWNGAGSVTGAVTSSSDTFSIGSAGNLTATAGLAVTGGSIAAAGTTSIITGDVNYTSAANSTFQGAIAGSGKTLTMNNGAATLTLTGANSYTGDTTVIAGTLVVGVNGAGSITSNVSVSSGATLGGSGTITGNVVNSGTLAAGNSPGILTVSGNLTQAAGSIFEWDINGNTTTQSGSAPYVFDQVVATGSDRNLTIDSSAIFRVVLGGGVSPEDAFWNTPNTTHQWENIFTGFTSVVGSFSNSNLEVVGSGLSGVGSFTITGTSLTWSAVPEPTSAFAGLLIGAGLLRRRRR